MRTFFDILIKDMKKYSNQGEIILSGDLNARTGDKQEDFIEDDNRNNLIQMSQYLDPDLNIL